MSMEPMANKNFRRNQYLINQLRKKLNHATGKNKQDREYEAEQYPRKGMYRKKTIRYLKHLIKVNSNRLSNEVIQEFRDGKATQNYPGQW